jgi:hypothetical protein
LARAAITIVNFGKSKDEFFADIGPLLQRSGIDERKTSIATRKRPAEVAVGRHERFSLEFRVSGSSSHNLGEHSASHALTGGASSTPLWMLDFRMRATLLASFAKL